MDEARWVTVFQGKPSKLEVLRGRLENEEIETFVPDQLTKMIDPFITGANPLDYRLQVPEADAARAREILATPVVALAPDDEDDDEGEATPEEILEIRAIRTVWLAVLLVTTPLAILAGVHYLLGVRKHGVRARNHGLAVTAFLFSVVLVATAILAPLLASDRPPGRQAYPRPPPLPASRFPFGG